MKMNQPTSNEDFIRLLEEKKYTDILDHCQEFMKKKVDSYLRNFDYYHQFRSDFFQEVYIHILTKSLPSPAFLKACKNGNSFKFYLAKSIRNILNTLLSKEKNKKQHTVAIQNIYPQNEDEFQLDKSSYFTDQSLKGFTDSQDILEQLSHKFKKYLNSFESLFPKIFPKLRLLLKLQARIEVNEEELKACFPGIRKKEIQGFIESIRPSQDYVQMEDKTIYQLAQPYFKNHRREKGSPAALQRWLNQHISGDKNSKGILDYLVIREAQQVFKIQDKKFFADFLHVYFKAEALTEAETLVPAEQVFAFNNLKSQVWAPVIVSR